MRQTGLPQLAVPKVETYSKCPKRCEYSLDREEPALTGKARLLKDVVCSAYLKVSRNQKPSGWRAVTAEIDKHILQGVPSREHPEYEQIASTQFKKSLLYLDRVKKAWYDKYYLTDGMEGFPDLNVGLQVHGIMVHDIIDLALFNEKELIVCKFTGIEPIQANLYNDMRLRCQALLLSKRLGRLVTRLRSLSWNEETDHIAVSEIFIHAQREFADTTEKALNQMVQGIKSGCFYPSVSEQCITCPFKKICSF